MNERKPLRLFLHNYSIPKSYFVTIKLDCKLRFGEINDNDVQLNDIGMIAKICWEDIPEHFKECELDEYVIMPDHIHGIIRINPAGVGDRYICPLHNDIHMNDKYICPLHNDIHMNDKYICPLHYDIHMNDRYECFSEDDIICNNKRKNDKTIRPYTDPDPQRHTQFLPKAIGCFKAAVSRKLHKKGYLEFKWQRSYYDRIVRKNEFERFKIYVKNNPAKWNDDEIE